MLLKELKCPGCGSPLKAKERDMMLQCSHCGKISLFTEGEIKSITFSIARPGKDDKGELIYVPFWIVNADLNVKSEKISGGKLSRFVTGQRQMRGNHDYYVCASDSIPEETSRKWNMDLSTNAPQYNPIDDFKDGKRIKMTMPENVAGENAEFLFLRYETEIPGVLQDLDYDFKVNSAKVLYLPAYNNVGKFKLGI